MNKAIIALIFTLILAVFALIFVRTSCVDFVESYEVGYMFNRMNGHTHVVRRTGYVFHAPFVVDVNTVDLRPMQVCINANSRVLNCKLVQFNKDGIELFLSWHGRQNYSEMDLSEILKAYAYEGTGRSYPFLTVLREIRPEDSQP